MCYFRFVVAIDNRSITIVCRDGNACVRAGILRLRDMFGREVLVRPENVVEIKEVSYELSPTNPRAADYSWSF